MPLKIDPDGKLKEMLRYYDHPAKHPKCRGWYDAFTGDYDCEYALTITCDECIYGVGNKHPETGEVVDE